MSVICLCFIPLAHLLKWMLNWSKGRIVSYTCLYLPLRYLLYPGGHLQLSHHLSNGFKVPLGSSQRNNAHSLLWNIGLRRGRSVFTCFCSRLTQARLRCPGSWRRHCMSLWWGCVSGQFLRVAPLCCQHRHNFSWTEWKPCWFNPEIYFWQAAG